MYHYALIPTSKMKSTEVQTLGANIRPGVDALLRVREALKKRTRFNEHLAWYMNIMRMRIFRKVKWPTGISRI